MQQVVSHMGETAKTVIDLSSIGVVVATLASWLPPIAATLAIIWTSLRIWEILRVRGWWRRRDE